AEIAGEDLAVFAEQTDGTEAVGGLDDARVEEGLAHAEVVGGEEDSALVFCAYFRLAGHEGREEPGGVVGPPGCLRSEGEQRAVVGVEGEARNGRVGGGVLGEPERAASTGVV